MSDIKNCPVCGKAEWPAIDGWSPENFVIEINALRADNARLLAERDGAKKVLREHHEWHLEAGEMGLQAHDGEWIGIGMAGEYCDSLLYERTAKALEGLPPDEAGPTPRGGMSAWWWGVGVLERRKRKKAEAERDAYAAQVAVLRDAVERINILTSAGSRTFDEMIRDMGYANDRARGAIRSIQGKENG